MNVPWLSITKSGADLSEIPGMIEAIEKQMLYWASSDYYSGLGEIVELGTFLGTSTECLAKGLIDNPTVKDKEKRLHCYDLFLCDEYNHRSYGPWLDRHNIVPGDSFLPLVERALKPYRPLLTINAGDIMHVSWVGRPIEILFVDMAVSWALSDQVIRAYFAALIPGKSLVIHQDYLFQRAPWLSITMEYFTDYFDVIGNADCSMVFRLNRPIPDDLLRRGTEGLPPQQKMLINERVIKRFGGVDTTLGAILALQRGCLLAMLGDHGGAKTFVESVLARNQHPVVTYRGRALLDALPSIQ